MDHSHVLLFSFLFEMSHDNTDSSSESTATLAAELRWQLCFGLNFDVRMLKLPQEQRAQSEEV